MLFKRVLSFPCKPIRPGFSKLIARGYPSQVQESPRPANLVSNDEITAKLQKFVAATISFREIIESGHYFADKSNLIYAMSSYVNTIFCRPRRFGKTTFHQMLQEYYDIKNAKTEDFEKLFGKLWIGKKDEKGEFINRTSDQGKYYILDLDFSGLKLDAKNPDAFVPTFENLIMEQMRKCWTKYDLNLQNIPRDPSHAALLLKEAAKETKIYAFVDEYDAPFTRTVIGSKLDVKQKTRLLDRIIASYNPFFESTKREQIRLFMTGIVDFSIPALSSQSFTRTTFSPLWHSLSGFTEAEVQALLDQLAAKIPDETDPRKKLIEDALPKLRDAYNGYWFARTDHQQPKMYNADMVLYFLRYVIDESKYLGSKAIIDRNASISNNILEFANSLPWLGGLLQLPKAGVPLFVKDSPALTVEMGDIMKIFEADLTLKEGSEALDTFLSLVYYYGALTTQRIGRLEDGKEQYELGIPNSVAKDEYLTKITAAIPTEAKSLNKAKEAFFTLINKQDPKPLVECFLNGDFHINDYGYGGTDVFDPESSLKHQLLTCFKLVSGKDEMIIHNEIGLKERVNVQGKLGTFSYFPDIILQPVDTKKWGTILELKNVPVSNLLDYKEYKNWEEKMEMAEEELNQKSEKQLLELKCEYRDKNQGGKVIITTVQELVEGGRRQAKKYLELTKLRQPKNISKQAGYHAWVWIRVGLTRILTFKVE